MRRGPFIAVAWGVALLLWGAVLLASGTRVPYEEYLVPVAIFASVAALVLPLQLEPRRSGFRFQEVGPHQIAAELRRRVGTLEADGTTLRGEIDGLRVRIDCGSDRPEIVIEGCPRVDLSPERLLSFEPHDLQTGDDAFDRRVRVWGNPLQCFAGLDARTRDQYLSALERLPNLAIAGGTLRGRFGEPPRVAGEVDGVLRSLLAVVKRLDPDDVPAALAANAIGDRSPGMRRRCLAILHERFLEQPDSKRALAAALLDEDPEVRVFAAIRSGPAGFDALDDAAAAPAVPEAVRVEALSRALRFFSRERARGLVERVLASDPPEAVRVAAVEGVRDPALEERVIDQLARGGETRRAAIETLARVGTARAVEPLSAIGGAAARDAIERIQARLSGAGAGQLALAPPEGGDLCLTERGGELSLPARGKKETP